MHKTTGFTLLESLISLSLFFIIFLGGLACLNSTKSHFHTLKDRYENWEALYAAADKIRLDAEQAALGLTEPIRLGLLTGVTVFDDNQVYMYSLEGIAAPLEDLQPGQTRIPLASAAWIKTARLICIHDQNGGEMNSVASPGRDHIILTAPLSRSYVREESQILVVKSVRYFLDDSSQVLRRQINTSPAQPLLENTVSFMTTYDPAYHLLDFTVRIESTKEYTHAFSIRPKNLVLAAVQ